METEPSQAAIGADDEVMNHAFKLRANNEENVKKKKVGEKKNLIRVLFHLK